MPEIKAVLFDLEGTVAYYEKRANPVIATEMIRAAGHEIYHQEWEFARKFVFFVDIPKGGISTWKAFMKRVFERLEINPEKEVIERVADYYEKNTVFKFFDDADIISALPVKKAIVTTIPNFYFTNLNLGTFDTVITGKDAGVPKPHPECFLMALEKLKTKPQEALMVGNDLNCDIFPAERLGMKAVLIDREGTMKEACHRKITSLKELKDIIK